MKKILSILLASCIIFSFSLSNVYALDPQNNNCYQLDDGVIWGEARNGVAYAAIVSDDNYVHLSKTILDDDSFDVFYKKFNYVSDDILYSETYWDGLIARAESERTTWNIVTGITHSDISTRSVATDKILSDLESMYGGPAYNTPVLIKTDSSTYPQYTFRVYETLTFGITQVKQSSFSATKTVADIALSLIDSTGIACTVASVVAEICDMYDIANVNGAQIAEAKTIITFLDTAVKDRFVTVNGGNVAYSSAYKKDGYASFVDALNFTVSSPVYDYTIYSPSSTIFNDSTYYQLIRLAYNAYV